MADRGTATQNLERGLAQLEAFAAMPVVHDRDRAGLIQAFEFTFELFWRCFQKLAPDAGLLAHTPRESLIAGAQLGWIAEAEAPEWSKMLRDRNLTSHTYDHALATEIVERLMTLYLPCFRAAIARLRSGTGLTST